jgi:hypothetical protein
LGREVVQCDAFEGLVSKIPDVYVLQGFNTAEVKVRCMTAIRVECGLGVRIAFTLFQLSFFRHLPGKVVSAGDSRHCPRLAGYHVDDRTCRIDQQCRISGFQCQ